MKNNMHQKRISMMEMLYQFDFYECNLEEFKKHCELNIQKDRFLKITSQYNTLDPIIDKHLSNYRFSRLSIVDRSIIRLALFEMLFEKLPKEIAINEALNLTKIYSNLDDDKQVKFNNKLLDKISKELQWNI